PGCEGSEERMNLALANGHGDPCPADPDPDDVELPSQRHQRMLRQKALQRATVEVVSADDLRSILRKLVERARDGDALAAKEAFGRVLGRPEARGVVRSTENMAELIRRLPDRSPD